MPGFRRNTAAINVIRFIKTFRVISRDLIIQPSTHLSKNASSLIFAGEQLRRIIISHG
jgi:hypothetical protein